MNSGRQAIFLTEKIPWFGSKTGYECLPLQLRMLGLATHEINVSSSVFNRAVGKLASLMLRAGPCNSLHSCAQFYAASRLAANPRQVLHILYGDHHASLWAKYPKAIQCRTLITLHQPRSQWTPESLSSLSTLRNVLFLYQKDISFFSEYMPHAQTSFIHYGTDTEFFRPASPSAETQIRLLYNGVHLRNIAMLRRLLPAIHSRFPEIQFDFLVPEHRRSFSDFGDLLTHPAITWHAGLDDNRLLALYQSASILLLPMEDSGANSAVVEALACGLPIVTTDVGGIRDYGGGSLYPVVPNNDDVAMFAELEALITNDNLRAERAQASRQFAESHLAWPSVAQCHSKLYDQLAA